MNACIAIYSNSDEFMFNDFNSFGWEIANEEFDT